MPAPCSKLQVDPCQERHRRWHFNWLTSLVLKEHHTIGCNRVFLCQFPCYLLFTPVEKFHAYETLKTLTKDSRSPILTQLKNIQKISIFFELCLWIKGRVDCTGITSSLSRTLQCNIFVPGQSWMVKSFMRTWVLESEPASNEMLLYVYSRHQETIDTSNMQASLVVVHLWTVPQLTDL